MLYSAAVSDGSEVASLNDDPQLPFRSHFTDKQWFTSSRFGGLNDQFSVIHPKNKPRKIENVRLQMLEKPGKNWGQRQYGPRKQQLFRNTHHLCATSQSDKIRHLVDPSNIAVCLKCHVGVHTHWKSGSCKINLSRPLNEKRVV